MNDKAEEKKMIKLVNVNKQYDLGDVQVNALSSVSLNIDRGEYIAIMGPSGSGKSTLMHIMGILDSITSGQYFLEDYDISSLPDREQARIRNQSLRFYFSEFQPLPRTQRHGECDAPHELCGGALSEEKSPGG